MKEVGITCTWCADRCLRDGRAWGGIPVLYRHLAPGGGPDFAFAPSEFKAGLGAVG